MNCTQCGAPVQKGQRFCVQCGAPLNAAPANEPKIDLSAYFDEPQVSDPASVREPEEDLFAFSPRETQRRPAPPVWEEGPEPRKSDRGLNIALIICTVLAVAVITFVVVLLLAPGKENTPANGPENDPVYVTDTPDSGILPSTAPTDTPIIIVTPTPLPSTAPTAAPTPSPTPDPTSEYLLPESNTRYLTETDLSGLTHEQLCFARNEIFARHGRIFQTPEIAAYFKDKSWYNGTVSAANFSESVFNEYERANISFISNYEKKYYGGSYY